MRASAALTFFASERSLELTICQTPRRPFLLCSLRTCRMALLCCPTIVCTKSCPHFRRKYCLPFHLAHRGHIRLLESGLQYGFPLCNVQRNRAQLIFLRDLKAILFLSYHVNGTVHKDRQCILSFTPSLFTTGGDRWLEKLQLSHHFYTISWTSGRKTSFGCKYG